MTDRTGPPADTHVRAWIGDAAFGYWERIKHLIEASYPGVFAAEWLYGGKHGWSLRYKKSRSFCTLIPERGRLAMLIVFGAKEREKVETTRDALAQQTRRLYDAATTYHDGKWLVLPVGTDRALEDAMRLLAAKRRPRA